jgi:transposase
MGAGVTAWRGRSVRAGMTLPPPAPARLLIDYRGLLPQAPVSDHSTSGRAPLCCLPAPDREMTAMSAGPQQESSPLEQALFFVGIDWAARTHAVCVLTPSGKQIAAFGIEHTAAGFTGLIRRLAKLGDPGKLPIAIERPDGRLVDALLAAGHPVVPVKPNAIKTWREAEVISGAKSDPGDAHVIAEYLRLRAHHLRAATPLTGSTTALRVASRTRSDLVAARVAATNQLAALLDVHWPGAKDVFFRLESPISLAFLRRYPTPTDASGLGEKQMAAFTTGHGYSGRRPPAQLVARLRTAPAGAAHPTITAALREAVLALVGVLTALNSAIRSLDRAAIATLHQHPDGKVFASFPRSGGISAAQIRAELSEPAAYTGPDAIAALAGLVPVTRSSGKHRAVSFRWACNKRLRAAITGFADNSRRASPWAADIYTRARASGKDHAHAIRILARAWVRIIWRCWIDQQPYDPGQHRGARPHLDTATAA